MSSDNEIRNLWSEVRASGDDGRRKAVETGGRVLYTLLIVVGGFLAFDLYTRPDSQVIKVFGVCAAVLLVLSDVFWAWATHHSAAGAQRFIARSFWAMGIVIYAFNVVSEYQHYLGVAMSEFTTMWYYSASVVTVVEAAVGWALYLMLSPEQKISDVAAKVKSDAVSALLKGIESPDAATAQLFNEQVQVASRDLARHAASVVRGHVGNLVASHSSNGNGQKAKHDDHPLS